VRNVTTMGEVLMLPDDPFNQELVRNVHPAGWKNPSPKGRYNLVVVGAGTAGLVSAVGAASLGARVALIERHLMGGDCLNYGCVPSKAVLRAARAAYEFGQASRFGVACSQGSAVDFARAMERMRRLRAAISKHDSAKRMTELGIDVYIGSAHFVGKDALEVGPQQFRFARAVIATGARAAAPPVPGLVEAGFLTNEAVFSLTTLPQRLLVIGAGPIGCEMAQAFRRLESEVIMLTRGARLLPKDDPDAASILATRFEREGIRVVTGVELERVEPIEGERVVFFKSEGKAAQIATDQILVGVGRVPNVEKLGLEAAGVHYDRAGVKVDDHLRTTNPRIYAAGDICSNYRFTHAADAMARIVIQNALFFGRKRLSHLVIPWCTYTDPEIAHVGLSEEEGRRRGFQVNTFTVPLSEVDRAILDEEAEGFARVHVEKKSGRILGATLVSAHAGESIGEVALAMTKGLGIAALSETIHPYPTQAEALKRTGDLYMRSRLKPWVKTLLTKFLSWRR
jgi:pyruvate/2-oxoglutarate dehydrogenase complex dihydrolipoamide dehydrogenase (E3) component